MNRPRSRWIGFEHIDSSGRSLAGLRGSYIKLVRLRRVREVYACKRNDDKGNKSVEDEEEAVRDVAKQRTEREEPERGWVRVKKRESINRGRVTGNRWYRGHRHNDKCLVHRFQLPTCFEGYLCPDDVAITKTPEAYIVILRDDNFIAFPLHWHEYASEISIFFFVHSNNFSA